MTYPDELVERDRNGFLALFEDKQCIDRLACRTALSEQLCDPAPAVFVLLIKLPG